MPLPQPEDYVSIAKISQLNDLHAAGVGPRGHAGVALLAADREWAAEEVAAVRSIADTALARPAAEPPPDSAVASAMPPADPMWRASPRFTRPFQAGQLFARPAEWHAAFAEAGLPLGARLRRWLREGYSTHVDRAALRGSPGRHHLTPEVEQWAVRKVRDELMPMGAVDEVVETQLPAGAVICNVVVAFKDGEPDRLCWAGGRINEALNTDSAWSSGRTLRDCCSQATGCAVSMSRMARAAVRLG